jgi:twitching motility protein PilU
MQTPTMTHDDASQFMQTLLTTMIRRGGSDLFLSAGFPPAIKADGKLERLSSQILSPQHTRTLAMAIMNDRQRADYERNRAVNFSIAPSSEIGRFRCNVFTQQGTVALVARKIPLEIPTVDALGLPAVLKELALTKRGLILFVGATGSGKSTSLAAMIDYRNTQTHGHIITIEDPIEFVHTHKNCIVNQREVGIDSQGWEDALKDTLRQAPDVILMGEIRDRETMEHAVAFAETGHLALATLHANNANQAIDRIINFFPEDRRQQLLMDLSLNLRAIVSQRLIRREDGKGRAAAVEILINTPLIADKILKGEVGDLKAVMGKSRELGMQTFDQALFDLFESHQISYEDALRNADSVNDLRLRMKLDGKRAGAGIDAGDQLAIV